MPFAVVGSNQIIEVKGRKVRGRMYPWGVVEVELVSVLEEVSVQEEAPSTAYCLRSTPCWPWMMTLSS